MEELSLELPSGRLQAVAHGAEDAPLVLCLHGLSSNARSWDFLGERIASLGRRAVALDLRGRGLSPATAATGLAAHAADVHAAATELGAEVFDVAGWSMGGLIGILAASSAAGRVRRLVLIDHAGRMDDAATRVVRAGLDRLGTHPDDVEAYVAAIRAQGGVERWTEQWDAVHRREFGRTSRAACEADLEDMLARDWTEAWRPLAMPTLLVRSTRAIEGGYIVPPDQRDGLAEHGRQVTVVEVDATHSDLMTDDATRAAVEAHL